MDMAHLGFGTQVASADGSYFLAGHPDAQTIAASGSKRVYMKFDLSGIFSQQKWIPLFAPGGLGLQLQLSLARANQAMIISHCSNTYSQGSTLSDTRLLSMCSVSNALQESYNAALLYGTSLKFLIKS